MSDGEKRPLLGAGDTTGSEAIASTPSLDQPPPYEEPAVPGTANTIPHPICTCILYMCVTDCML